MSKKIKFEYLILSIMLVLGFGVRLYKINTPLADWHSWRQADTASVSRSFVDKGINFFYPSYQDISSIQTGIFNPKGLRLVEFPIFNVFHALLAKSYPQLSFEIWGRLLSIVSALVSAIFLFLIGRHFLGSGGGLLATAFFLFLPYNIYFTRVILPEPMATTFALIGVWLFLQFLTAEKWRWLYLSGLFFALSLLIKPFVFFFLIPLIYLAWRKIKAKTLIRFLIFINLVLAPFFLWRIWINQYPAGIPFFNWAFNGDRIRFRPAFWRWIFAERIGRLILGIWGLIPFSLGILSAKKKNLFNLIFFLGGIFYVTLVATANVRHDYYQTFLIPAVALVLAEGTLFLWQNKIFERWISRSLAVFSILMMFSVGAYQIKEFYKINHPEIIAAGRAVDRLTPKDALVIAPYNGDTAFLYQTKRWGWPAIDDSIDRIIQKGADYYVSVNKGDADTKMIVGRFKVIEETDDYLVADLHQPKPK